MHDAAQLQRILHEAGQNIPRYLFRVWGSCCGGDSRLNTPQQITPHAFKDGKGPSSTTEVDHQAIADSIRHHLRYEPHDSFFSSWSASLAAVLRVACNREFANHDTDQHIAIIDTHKL